MSPDAPAASSPATNNRAMGGVAVFILAAAMAISTISTDGRYVPDKWLNQDGTFYFLTLRTLVDHHTLAQDNTQPRSWYEQELRWNRNLGPDWSDVAVGRDGHWYPKHQILLPLATIPFFFAFGALGALILNVLCLSLIPVLGYRLALRVAPWPAALAAGALMASSAYLSGQAYGYSNDLFYAVLVLAAFDAALSGAAGWAGLLFGFSVFAKATNAVYAVPFGLIYLLQRDLKSAIRFTLWAAPPLLVFAGLNTWMYEAPWHTGYNHILIREGGVPGFHDHATDFDWAHYTDHLKAILLQPGGFGMHDRALWWYLALPGCVVALVRAPKIAGPLLVAAAAPLLLTAPFKWFRVEFLDASVGMSLPFIAALLIPWAKRPGPADEPALAPGRVRWDRLGPVGALALLAGCGAVRALLPTHQGYFSAHLNQGEVFLGQIPCDYFNWQVQRWECSGFDQGRDPLMTGRSLATPVKFGGHELDLLELRPHPSGQPRRIEFEGVPLTSQLSIRYGILENPLPNIRESFRVSVNGQVTDLPLPPTGELFTQTVDTSPLAGQSGKVIFELASSGPGPGVYFDGDPR